MAAVVVSLISIVLRCTVGIWGYSGAGKPPMYGDFEAQRHWLEITTNLPIGDWYRKTRLNDLQYWGLDYPPLTAYVSWLFGKLANIIYQPMVAIHQSRGIETIECKIFMRISVILCDILVFFPSIFLNIFCTDIVNASNLSAAKKYGLVFVALTTPTILLIDHGHFQYNAVCIGLALLGSYHIVKGNRILGSVFFCLSLNFKQMALYYAPVFFFSLLRTCRSTSAIKSLWLLIALGVTVIISFGVLWAPFCIFASEEETCSSSLLQVLHRLFPFARGLFEDKVANLWYCLSVVVDIRQLFPVDMLAKCSLALTLLLLSPTAYVLLSRNITSHRMILALVNCSLSFFLASFQVHEKSLLLPLVPATLLLATEPLLISWFQVLGAFSMFPLLIRDGLRLPYFALIVFFVAVSYVVTNGTNSPLSSAPTGNGANSSMNHYFQSCKIQFLSHSLKVFLVAMSALGMVALHLMEIFLPAPTRLPDLYAALFSIYSAANLVVFYLIMNYWQFLLPDFQLVQSQSKKDQ